MSETVVGLAARRRSLFSGLRRCASVERATVAHDIKTFVRRFGDSPHLAHDVMLYGFLLSADPSSCSLAALADRHLGHSLDSGPAAEASAVLALFHKLRPAVETAGLADVYSKIDLPLIRVLADIETTGITVDPAQLKVLSSRMEEEITRLSAEIYELAGKSFQHQLAPTIWARFCSKTWSCPHPVRYGKGKTVSTAADVLRRPKPPNTSHRRKSFGIPPALQTKRAPMSTRYPRSSIRSPDACTPPSTRPAPPPVAFRPPIRTFRTSPSAPNWAAKFEPPSSPAQVGKLIVADYSQIELRLLAHMSRDPVLVEAFRNGEEHPHPHRRRRVFGVPPLIDHLSEQRRNAKAVNFGIVYGQTAFGLAASLEHRPQRSRPLHSRLFRALLRRPPLHRRDYRRGPAAPRLCFKYVFGRKRPIPDMQSKKSQRPQFPPSETAVNTPCPRHRRRGSHQAGDDPHPRRPPRACRLKCSCQVHDELVFEAPPEEVRRRARYGEIGNDGIRRAARRAAGSRRRRGRQLALMRNRILAALLVTMTLSMTQTAQAHRDRCRSKKRVHANPRS